jgi:hypothetical protein
MTTPNKNMQNPESPPNTGTGVQSLSRMKREAVTDPLKLVYEFNELKSDVEDLIKDLELIAEDRIHGTEKSMVVHAVAMQSIAQDAITRWRLKYGTPKQK